MALTTAEQVRLRLNDPWRYRAEVRYGDGSASAFRLEQGAPYSVISALSVSVPGVGGWVATGGTAQNTAQGVVYTQSAISALSAIQFTYQWAVFSDDELAFFTAQGDVRAAVLMGVRTLMGNAWKRARWQAPDGSQYDDSKALANLRAWESSLIAERVVEEGPAGGFVNWADSQGDY